MKMIIRRLWISAAFLSLFSFNCNKESPEDNSVTDVEGNLYKTVRIGRQVWMAENLRVTHYRNGEPIDYVGDSAGWGSHQPGAYCDVYNDPSNSTTYGLLYNWWAVNDPRGISPEGWHVPSNDEWQTLEDFIGADDAGGKLKANYLWASPNTGATNIYGFSALPAGQRYTNGEFDDLSYDGYWWTSTGSFSSAWCWRMFYDSEITKGYQYYVQEGYSVRCVKD